MRHLSSIIGGVVLAGLLGSAAATAAPPAADKKSVALAPDKVTERNIEVIAMAEKELGLIVGAVWAGQASGYAGSDPRVQAMSLQDPKIFVALVCWAVYSFELFAARRIGWGGRRAAYLSALGFAIVLLNFVPISYFLTRSHNF